VAWCVSKSAMKTLRAVEALSHLAIGGAGDLHPRSSNRSAAAPRPVGPAPVWVSAGKSASSPCRAAPEPDAPRQQALALGAELLWRSTDEGDRLGVTPSHSPAACAGNSTPGGGAFGEADMTISLVGVSFNLQRRRASFDALTLAQDEEIFFLASRTSSS